MNMLRRALKYVIDPAPVAVDVQPAPDARQQLRDALKAHKGALQAKKQADAAAARVEQLVRQAEDADEAVAAAEAAASGATQAWAERGARIGTSPVDRSLLDRAQSAAQSAADAHTMAAGAKKALPALNEAVADALLAISQTDDKICSAVAEVMFAEVEPQFAVIEDAAARYNEALADVKSLQLIFRHWGPFHPFHKFSSPNKAADIERHLKRNAIQAPGDSELYKQAQSWMKLAERLAVDPDAIL